MTTSPFPPSPFPPSPFPPAAPPTAPAAAPTGADPIRIDSHTLPPNLEGIVRIANEKGYSDVHLGVGEEPRYRARGDMARTGWPVTDAATFNAWMREMLSPAEIDAFQRDKEYDGSHAFPFVRVRINLMDSLRGPAMVLRLIPQTIATLEDLNLPPVLKELCARPKGMILITGPTGSGKSTTLASLIDFINKNYDHHIITIEDPIEFYHRSQKSTVNQREIGNDVPSFSEALRRALRQDPDVILVGELRDLETIEAAISAAETGHVVFGTLHTSSAQGTINRIIDAFPTNQQEQVRTQLSTAIIGVVSQALLPKIGGGRCAAYEVLVVDDGIGNLIRENKTFRINSSIQTGSKKGMRLLDDDLFRLWNEKKVTEEAVLAKAQKVDDLAKRILNAKQGIFDDEETVARKAKDEK